MQRMNQDTDRCGHCGRPFAHGEARWFLGGNAPYHDGCINAVWPRDEKMAALEKRVAILERQMRAVLPEAPSRSVTIPSQQRECD